MSNNEKNDDIDNTFAGHVRDGYGIPYSQYMTHGGAAREEEPEYGSYGARLTELMQDFISAPPPSHPEASLEQNGEETHQGSSLSCIQLADLIEQEAALGPDVNWLAPRSTKQIAVFFELQPSVDEPNTNNL